MLKTAITDQKRLVRGLHWERARYFLRVRDGAHNLAWKILIIAGPAPHEEVNSIRSLMPRAHITAVDVDERNVLAAIDAGVDEAHHMDIAAFEKEQSGRYSLVTVLPRPLDHLGPGGSLGQETREDRRFDAICLDLTGPANDWLRQVVSLYHSHALRPRGAMILTFSYGRDVVERMHEEWRLATAKQYVSWDPTEQLIDIPDQIVSRVWYVLRMLSHQLDSCLQYRGNRMPMVSCLLLKKSMPSSSPLPVAQFRSIDKGDYERAITADDPGKQFACPAERVDYLRKQKESRSSAARKAVATRRRRNEIGQRKMLLLQGPRPSEIDK